MYPKSDNEPYSPLRVCGGQNSQDMQRTARALPYNRLSFVQSVRLRGGQNAPEDLHMVGGTTDVRVMQWLDRPLKVCRRANSLEGLHGRRKNGRVNDAMARPTA